FHALGSSPNSLEFNCVRYHEITLSLNPGKLQRGSRFGHRRSAADHLTSCATFHKLSRARLHAVTSLTKGASMRRRMKFQSLILALIGAGLIFMPASPAHAQERKPDNSTTKPVPRDPKWVKQHEKFVAMAQKGNIDVLFLGDSITDAWGGEGHNPKSAGKDVFAKEFEPLK